MIVASAVVTTAIENTAIVAAAESTAGAEVEALPFKFSTSWRTCICSMQFTASFLEDPFILMTFGILSLPARSGLDSHAKNRLAAPLTQASAQFFLKDIDIKKSVLCRDLWAMLSRRKSNNHSKTALSDLAPKALG